MVDLLITFYFGRVMWEVLVNCKVKRKCAGLVHALVWFDDEHKVQDIVGVGEGHFHGGAEGQFCEVCHVERKGRLFSGSSLGMKAALDAVWDAYLAAPAVVRR